MVWYRKSLVKRIIRKICCRRPRRPWIFFYCSSLDDINPLFKGTTHTNFVKTIVSEHNTVIALLYYVRACWKVTQADVLCWNEKIIPGLIILIAPIRVPSSGQRWVFGLLTSWFGHKTWGCKSSFSNSIILLEHNTHRHTHTRTWTHTCTHTR